jgi:hypothetical protein
MMTTAEKAITNLFSLRLWRARIITRASRACGRGCLQRCRCSGDLWHGGCANHAQVGTTRRAIHLGFACDSTRPQYDITANFEGHDEGPGGAAEWLRDATPAAAAAGLLPRRDWEWLV